MKERGSFFKQRSIRWA